MNFNGKSLHGSLAFFISALLILLAFKDTWGGSFFLTAAIALLATTAELFSGKIKINDNLLSPLVCGFACFVIKNL